MDPRRMAFIKALQASMIADNYPAGHLDDMRKGNTMIDNLGYDDYTLEQMTIDLLAKAEGKPRTRSDTMVFKIHHGGTIKNIYWAPPFVRASEILDAIVQNPRPFKMEGVTRRNIKMWDGGEMPITLDKRFYPRAEPYDLQVQLVNFRN